MERTKIIEALECCTQKDEKGWLCPVCVDCPFSIGKDDCKALDEYALALIKELQAQNENLQKENKKLLDENKPLNLRLQTPLSPNHDIYNKNLEAQIKEQEERIKELEAQDTERVKHIQTLNDCRIAAEEQARNANAEIEELRAYNETLQRENKYLRERLAEEAEIKEDMSVDFTCVFGQPHKVSDCPITEEIDKAKADTVKKMQERLKQTYDREHIETGRRFVSLEIVDLVAKAMLEGAI